MTLIVGIGQPFAGDDGVGRAVARHLNAEGVPAAEAGDGAALLALLDGAPRAVLIDAAVGAGRPGTVLVLPDGELPGAGRPVSSHALSVHEAVAIAKALGPIDIQIVAVAIGKAARGNEMSPAVARAVPQAAAWARALAQSTR